MTGVQTCALPISCASIAVVYNRFSIIVAYTLVSLPIELYTVGLNDMSSGEANCSVGLEIVFGLDELYIDVFS